MSESASELEELYRTFVLGDGEVPQQLADHFLRSEHTLSADDVKVFAEELSRIGRKRRTMKLEDAGMRALFNTLTWRWIRSRGDAGATHVETDVVGRLQTLVASHVSEENFAKVWDYLVTKVEKGTLVVDDCLALAKRRDKFIWRKKRPPEVPLSTIGADGVMVPVEVPVFHNVPVDVLASVTGSELSDAQVWNWAHLKRAVAVVSSGLGLKRPRARQSECCRASTQTAAAFLDAQGWSVEGIGAALELAPVDVPGELAAGKRRLLESSADDSDEVYEASKCAFRAPELELWADVVRACSEQRANIVPSTVRDFLEVEEVLEKARKASEVHDPLDPDPRAVVVSFLAVNGFRAGELEMLLALSDEVIKALKIEGAELLAEILFAFPQDGGAPLQLMEMFAAAPGAVELELALALETTAPETDAEGTVTLSRSPHVANALILLGWDPTPFVERSALAELNELAANALDERGSMIWRKRTRELASLDLLALELGLPGGGAGNVSWIEAELRKVLAQVARALLQRRLEEFVRHRNCNPQLAASREHLGCLVVRDGVRPAFYERALKRLDGRRRRVIEKHTRLFHDPVPFARWLDLRFLISTARDRLSQRAGREVGPMEVFAERCGPTGDPERCRSFARIAARRGLSEATVVERYVTALAHLALSLTDHDPHGLGDRIP